MVDKEATFASDFTFKPLIILQQWKIPINQVLARSNFISGDKNDEKMPRKLSTQVNSRIVSKYRVNYVNNNIKNPAEITSVIFNIHDLNALARGRLYFTCTR